MARTLHISIELDLLESLVRKAPIRQHILRDASGAYVSNKDALAEIAQMRAHGFEVWPPCEHVDSRGMCLGHEKVEA